MKELLIGCGRNKQKKIKIKNEDSTEWNNVITLDINPDNEPDVLWDLNNLPYPFEDNSFDEIHAYEVLEHLGSLGDYKSFLYPRRQKTQSPLGAGMNGGKITHTHTHTLYRVSHCGRKIGSG